MSRVQILIVEDEFIVAEDIRGNLEKLGYTICAIAKTGEAAIATVRMNSPDIVLVDIRLGDGLDGIDAVEAIRKIANVPFIYITAHSDSATFERAKKTVPHAYIVKPFNFQNLHTAIELALYNFSRRSGSYPGELDIEKQNKESRPESYVIQDAIFIKVGKGFEKVKLKDIWFVKADGSYCVLFTEYKEYILTINLQSVQSKLNRPELFRVHRSYLVNLHCIERIDERGVVIRNTIIPVSRKLREELLQKIPAL